MNSRLRATSSAARERQPYRPGHRWAGLRLVVKESGERVEVPSAPSPRIRAPKPLYRRRELWRQQLQRRAVSS
jgi:hypothetical protein